MTASASGGGGVVVTGGGGVVVTGGGGVVVTGGGGVVVTGAAALTRPASGSSPPASCWESRQSLVVVAATPAVGNAIQRDEAARVRNCHALDAAFHCPRSPAGALQMAVRAILIPGLRERLGSRLRNNPREKSSLRTAPGHHLVGRQVPVASLEIGIDDVEGHQGHLRDVKRMRRCHNDNGVLAVSRPRRSCHAPRGCGDPAVSRLLRPNSRGPPMLSVSRAPTGHNGMTDGMSF